MKFKRDKKQSKSDAVQLEIEAALKNTKARPMVYLGENLALTETIFGDSMIVNTCDISLAPHILMKGYWEIWITKFFLETIEEGMCILEVGANIGYYTLLAARRIGSTGKVFAFEADPENFEVLHKNIEVNGFIDKAQIVNKAVADRIGEVSFTKLKTHHGSSSLIEFDANFLEKYRDTASVISVESVTIDDFFGDEIPDIDLIKLDAEGSEPLILRGMAKTIHQNQKLKIITEFAPSLITRLDESPRDFLDSLENLGFKVQVIDPVNGVGFRNKDEILKLQYCELLLERQ
jgi:FkbM family methyltransferase